MSSGLKLLEIFKLLENETYVIVKLPLEFPITYVSFSKNLNISNNFNPLDILLSPYIH